MASEPVQAEARLATAIERCEGDAELVAGEISAIGRENIEFTGRCFALAITSGFTDVAVLLGRAGFHLNVMDEPAVQAELAAAGGQTRGLVDFMQRYRSCRAQRTYYLPVVQADAATGPVAALLHEGAGLTGRDCSELLSLAVRQDNIPLARVLAEGGARLVGDIHEAAPNELAGKMDVAVPSNPWTDMLSPRGSIEAIAFVIEQLGDEPCPVRADWFKLYFRDPLFAEKLALIAPHASNATCEDAASLLAELARSGHTDAVRAVLAWNGLPEGCFEPALSAAREAGHVEITAALLQAQNARTPGLAMLEF